MKRYMTKWQHFCKCVGSMATAWGL